MGEGKFLILIKAGERSSRSFIYSLRLNIETFFAHFPQYLFSVRSLVLLAGTTIHLKNRLQVDSK